MNPSASRHHQLSGKYLYSQLEVDQGVWVTRPHWWLQYQPDQALAFRWFYSNILPWKNRRIVLFFFFPSSSFGESFLEDLLQHLFL